ncbi:interferon-induced very large GTPase 1-like isoform X2 [Lissotriton helveticus]
MFNWVNVLLLNLKLKAILKLEFPNYVASRSYHVITRSKGFFFFTYQLDLQFESRRNRLRVSHRRLKGRVYGRRKSLRKESDGKMQPESRSKDTSAGAEGNPIRSTGARRKASRKSSCRNMQPKSRSKDTSAGAEENPIRITGARFSQHKMQSSEGNSMEIIKRLINEFSDILQSYSEDILVELDSWSLITQEQLFWLSAVVDPKEKVIDVLNIILQKGESACLQLLECLENLQYAFPHLFQVLKNIGKDVRKDYELIRCNLNMNSYENKNLSSCDILKLCPGSITEFKIERLEDIPWCFMRKLMSLNVTTRQTKVKQTTFDHTDKNTIAGKNKTVEHGDFESDNRIDSIHPLDVLCVLLHCSDGILQQEIMQKMSMCHFALPLLLPPSDYPKCTFLLWAMRDIVRQWKPASLGDAALCKEESLVLTPMPIISFVRLGQCSLSKSKILNEVLSPPQQHHDFFIHREMESGNVPRRISDGLVEISWYYPGGRKNSDVFPEPVAVTNLRGDIESHWLQFSFLLQESTAVFIFTNNINESAFQKFSSLDESLRKLYFFLPEKAINSKTQEYIQSLTSAQENNESRVLLKDKTMNDAQFVENVQNSIKCILKTSTCPKSLESMAFTARNLGIKVDEDSEECTRARECAEQITAKITSVVEYKEKTMRLQGALWREVTRVEKEMCRMKRQADTPVETYRSQLKKELIKLRTQQHKDPVPANIQTFLSGLEEQSEVKKHYFLKWMKLNLDHIARKNLSRLREDYKKQLKTPGKDNKKLLELDRRICESSLGVEHFMREVGQLYESEAFLVKEGKLNKKQCQFSKLPDFAVHLLLEGFPLELIDGDVSNIPLQWITDVFTALNKKLGGRRKLVVITVLGVQSTGKSTLLNTMFGLQFSVSSGRCTRGAFMLLMKVDENLRKELGCDFILVIDTEGLKAPELMTLEDSYDHDNELATMVIGLSDITIVNLAMENATEMKDVLQIVVHAFLRMEKIGKKINCQFVHQNVSDVSAAGKNMRDREKLLQQLNEMTKAASVMEKQSKEITFSDIIEYDTEKHTWYIPGLWHGVPPMAPVNLGYSESVHELKMYLFEFMKTRTAQDIPSFIEWLKSLWNAVKHERFIFSFRNSLAAAAYNQLSRTYGDWEWAFRKEVQELITRGVTKIQNQSPDQAENAFKEIKLEADKKIYQKGQVILKDLEDYFKSGATNVRLVEEYKGDFILSAQRLQQELKNTLGSKLTDAFTIRKSRIETDRILAVCRASIEGHVERLLEDCKTRENKLTEKELETAFEAMWTSAFSSLPCCPLKKIQVHEGMKWQVLEDLQNRGPAYNELAQSMNLIGYKCKSPEENRSLFGKIMKYPMIPLHYVKNRYNAFINMKGNKKEYFETNCYPSDVIMAKCEQFAREKVAERGDYNSTYSEELLRMINEDIEQKKADKIDFTPQMEVDLKRDILGHAASFFQEMHDNFLKENDPHHHVKTLKPQYLSTFKDVYQEKDACLTKAEYFCSECLKPSLVEYVNKRLGTEVMDDNSSEAFSCRSFLQYNSLRYLLEKNDFELFLSYTSNYESFVKAWIWERILENYQNESGLGTLDTKIYSEIERKVKTALSKSENQETVADFLKEFSTVLESDICIRKGSTAVIAFKTKFNVSEFVKHVNYFLDRLRKDILEELKVIKIENRLTDIPVRIVDELFLKLYGCGKQCPFCKVPCDAGASVHKEHFASSHRPVGLGQYRNTKTTILVNAICTSRVCSDHTFQNSDTEWKECPYKDYRNFYPDWKIQPDDSLTASDYWKFVFKEYNDQFAQAYGALPAEIPDDWKELTKEKALQSLEETFLVKTKNN